MRLFSIGDGERRTPPEPQPYIPSEGSGSDLDEESVRAKIDPMKGQVYDFLRNVNVYEEFNRDVNKPYYMEQKRLKGFATKEGTDRYYRRAMNENEMDDFQVHHENFRCPFNSEVKVSTLGIGSYIGEPDDLTDFDMYDAVKQSVLSGGINHIDTAPNFRYMKSEKTIGKILTTLESKYDINRDQLFVTTKAGYIPEDAENEIPLRQMIERLVDRDGVPEDAIVQESAHCMHPTFLKVQLEESLKRLNLECLDVLYLQNPYEAQGPYNTDNVFFDRLAEAFEFLESMVEEGKIK